MVPLTSSQVHFAKTQPKEITATIPLSGGVGDVTSPAQSLYISLVLYTLCAQNAIVLHFTYRVFVVKYVFKT